MNEFGILIGAFVILASIFCGIALIAAGMRSGQISETERKRDEQNSE